MEAIVTTLSGKSNVLFSIKLIFSTTLVLYDRINDLGKHGSLTNAHALAIESSHKYDPWTLHPLNDQSIKVGCVNKLTWVFDFHRNYLGDGNIHMSFRTCWINPRCRSMSIKFQELI